MCTNEDLCELSTELITATSITRKYAMAGERELVYLDTRIVVILPAHELVRAYTQ